MIRTGDSAQGFELPVRPGEMTDVGAAMSGGKVVLLFFPLAFSPVCTDEFCTIRDDWASYESLDAKVFGINSTVRSSTRIRRRARLPFELLSDFNRTSLGHGRTARGSLRHEGRGQAVHSSSTTERSSTTGSVRIRRCRSISTPFMTLGATAGPGIGQHKEAAGRLSVADLSRQGGGDSRRMNVAVLDVHAEPFLRAGSPRFRQRRLPVRSFPLSGSGQGVIRSCACNADRIHEAAVVLIADLGSRHRPAVHARCRCPVRQVSRRPV